MSSKNFRRNQRWRMSRNLQKRRVKFYQLEKRVAHLEGFREVCILDAENQADLLRALEMKIDALADENKHLRKSRKPSLIQQMWALMRATLAQKGNP